MNKLILILAFAVLVLVGVDATAQMVCGPNGCYFVGGGGYSQPVMRAPMVQVYAPPRPVMRYSGYGGGYYAQPMQSYGSSGGVAGGGYGSSGGYAPAQMAAPMQSYGSSGGVSGYGYGW